MLDERSPALVPSSSDDLPVDLVAGSHPADDVAGQAALTCDPYSALERYPAHQPRVGEVLAPAAGLPDALVGLIPVLGQPLDDPSIDRAKRRGRSACRTCCRGRPSRSARRRCRAAAGGRRRCRSSPGPSRDSPRDESACSSGSSARPSMPYMICSGPDSPTRQSRNRSRQPTHERLCLLAKAQAQKRIKRESRVANPSVAVVPVALAAELLGQRCRRRRDDRPRRLVGQAASASAPSGAPSRASARCSATATASGASSQPSPRPSRASAAAEWP